MTVPVTAPEQRASGGDAITLEVIRHGLVAAAEQMATAIERSAHSQVIREMLDYSTAVFDRSGGIVAQSTRIPMHLNSMTRALRTLIARADGAFSRSLNCPPAPSKETR